MDQNTNKERRREPRKDCLVWKPAELIEECGIMKLLIWLFDMLSACFFFPAIHFSSLSPLPSSSFIISDSGCRSFRPGGGYPPVGPWQAQSQCVFEERGQSANTTIEQWVPHHFTDSPTQLVLERGFPVWTLNVHLFVCVCETLLPCTVFRGITV